MSPLIESLKRRYQAGKIGIEKLQELQSNNNITQEEYDYITGE